MVPRLLPSLFLVALLAASVRELAMPEPTAARGPHAVEIVGPDGPFWSGTAFASSPLEALVGGGDQAAFSIETETSAGFGSGCAGTYVTAIGPYRETASGGWNYYVRGAGDAAWRWGSVSAACYALEPGDDVQWRWVSA